MTAESVTESPEKLSAYRRVKRRVGSFIASFLTQWRDTQANRYFDYSEFPGRWLRNRGRGYHFVSMEELRQRKKSDTVFVICSGPSVKDLTPDQWREIGRHGSIGINYSYLLPHVPTYHIFSWERNIIPRTTLVHAFQSHRARYSSCAIMLQSRAVFRGAHPRLLPEYFPEKAECCFYWSPDSIDFDRERPFEDRDFEKTVFYRNTASHAVELCVNHLQFRKIVLLGVDLMTPAHFYDGYPEVAPIEPALRKLAEAGVMMPMIPKGNKIQPFDVYFYALAEYLKRRRNVEMFVQNPRNCLYPRLRAYFDP